MYLMPLPSRRRRSDTFSQKTSSFAPRIPTVKPIDSDGADSLLSSPDVKNRVDTDEVFPPDSASAINRRIEADTSSVDSFLSSPPTTHRVCQAHLISLHPKFDMFADRPCNGERIRQVRLLPCDKLWQNGSVVQSADGAGAVVILRGKHRE